MKICCKINLSELVKFFPTIPKVKKKDFVNRKNCNFNKNINNQFITLNRNIDFEFCC